MIKLNIKEYVCVSQMGRKEKGFRSREDRGAKKVEGEAA